MSDYGFSDIECKIILDQIARRAKYREEFLRLRTDPCKHSQEAGFVFDPALQRFISMKSCQIDHFQPNFRTAMYGLTVVVLPMLAYGYFVWKSRRDIERKIRCGEIRYRDRMFKFQ